jgi:hypothetical protein
MLGAAHYHAVGYPYGPSLATGQVLGGGIIWILGDFVGLPFLAVQLIQMMRADKQEADEIDTELDARDAARAARTPRVTVPSAVGDQVVEAEGTPEAGETQGTGETADVAASDPGEPDRPWWETDSRLTDRFKRA